MRGRSSYTYDPACRLASVTYPGAAGTVAYDYDAAGRLQTVTDWASRVTSNAYDNASRVTSITRPVDCRVRSPTTSSIARRPSPTRSGATILTQGYTYDANGNVATLTDDTGTATFIYDDLDRLTDATYPGSQDYEYTNDAVGNVLTATNPAGTTTRAYDLADRITTSGCTYDDNGALTADPSRTYAYDALGRLLSSTKSGVAATYSLDGAGNRWAETVGGTTTSFDLDLAQANPTTSRRRSEVPGRITVRWLRRIRHAVARPYRPRRDAHPVRQPGWRHYDRRSP